MLLALDTSTRRAGVALYDPEEGVVGELTWIAGRRHAEQLLAAVDRLLTWVGRSLDEVTGLGVALGPGSFTGLRVGLGVAKGMAAARGLPVVGVSTLEFTAYPHRNAALPACAVLQAGRGRIAVQTFGPRERQWVPLDEPRLTTWEELLPTVQRTTLFCGELSAEEVRLLRTTLGRLAFLPPQAARVRRPGFLAELAWERLEASGGQGDVLALLEPIYLTPGVQVQP